MRRFRGASVPRTSQWSPQGRFEAWKWIEGRDTITLNEEPLIPRRPQYRKPIRRRPGEAPPTHRVYLTNEPPLKEGPAAAEGRSYFRARLDSEPSPEWMRAYRAGILGLLPEDRDAVLRFEFQGDGVRFAAAEAEVGRLRRVLERRVEAVNSILSGGRGPGSPER